MYGQVNPLPGRKVTGVFRDQSNETIWFDTDKGPIVFVTGGDCCSQTWIAHISGVDALLGSTVGKVEDIDMPDADDDMEGRDCVRFYGMQMTTDKGIFLVEYRNESNGYYGGSLDLIYPQGRATQPDKKLYGPIEITEDF